MHADPSFCKATSRNIDQYAGELPERRTLADFEAARAEAEIIVVADEDLLSALQLAPQLVKRADAIWQCEPAQKVCKSRPPFLRDILVHKDKQGRVMSRDFVPALVA